MALILAIEPDRRQASKLAAIVKNRLHEEILQADTTEHAIAALGARIPDLILTSLLLSRKHTIALTDGNHRAHYGEGASPDHEPRGLDTGAVLGPAILRRERKSAAAGIRNRGGHDRTD